MSKEEMELYNVLLTKTGGLLGPISDFLGFILDGIYNGLDFIGIQNVAIVIVLFTFIVRGLMIPLTIKQQKFSKLSAKMNPEIQKITAKYKGKKDEASMRKQQAETQAVYQKYGANPTAGCLPLLITLPIMFALYRVIYNIPAYVSSIYVTYANIAEAISGTPGYVDIMKGFAESLTVNTKTFTEMSGGSLTIPHIIDIFVKFKTDDWAQLATQFPSVQNIITENSAEIVRIHRFIGNLNILDQPGFTFPAILIPILAAALQWFQTKQMTSLNPPADKENPMASSMAAMNNVMPIMSGVFCFMFPIGVGIYWVAGSVFAIIQQFVINKYMDRIDIDELIEKNVMKANKRKAKLGIDPNASMEELAKKQTKSINAHIPEKEESSKSMTDLANSVKKNYEASNYKKSDVSYGAGSISANANLLKNRNSDKGEK